MTLSLHPGPTRTLVVRMVKGASGPLLGVLTLVAVPLLGRAFLTDLPFAFWALLATVGTAAVVVDLGGPLHTSAALAQPGTDHRGALLRGLRYAAGGAVAVTVVACAAWVPYAQLTELGQIGVGTGLAALLAMGAAAAVRSVGTVAAAAALAFDDFTVRTLTLAAQAIVTLTATLALLLAGAGFWSLPAGTALGGGLPALGALLWLRHRHPSLSARRPAVAAAAEQREARELAGVRVRVAGLSLALTQADRWVVGAVGGPALLAAYEVAWRLAVLPKLGVLALTGVLVPDAARLRTSGQRAIASQARRATRITALLTGLGALVAAGLAALVLPRLVPDATWSTAALFTVLLLGHSVHALTAAGTMMGNGLGRPRCELGYLVLAVSVAVTGWAAAVTLDLPELAAGAATGGLVIGSGFFLLTRPYLRENAATA